MPQESEKLGIRRTPAEKVDFKMMLQNVNMLYLGVKVLILLDLSYLGRFWVGALPACPCMCSECSPHSRRGDARLTARLRRRRLPWNVADDV